jgi:hypothetical protein
MGRMMPEAPTDFNNMLFDAMEKQKGHGISDLIEENPANRDND